MEKNKGEKNGKSVVSDRQALHIKKMSFEQGLKIKKIQEYYPELKYNTIYRIIHNRYMFLNYLIKIK